MRAIVLAAGLGSRLTRADPDSPKTLCSLDDGVTILGTILDSIDSAQISDICIVAGHGYTYLADFSERLQLTSPHLKLSFVMVDNFATHNNAYSLWCARHSLNADTLIVNSDTVFKPEVIERLRRTKAETDVVMAVDSIRALSAEAMKARLAGGMVTELSKGIDHTRGGDFGEYIGVLVVRSVGISKLVEALQQAWSMNLNAYYEDAISHGIQDQLSVVAIDTGDLPWQEVDTDDDLQLARALYRDHFVVGVDRGHRA